MTDHGKLFKVVYETDVGPSGEIHPHIWTYRPRISLEHLKQTLETMKDTKHLLLKEFLKMVKYGLRFNKQKILKLPNTIIPYSHKKP